MAAPDDQAVRAAAAVGQTVQDAIAHPADQAQEGPSGHDAAAAQALHDPAPLAAAAALKKAYAVQQSAVQVHLRGKRQVTADSHLLGWWLQSQVDLARHPDPWVLDAVLHGSHPPGWSPYCLPLQQTPVRGQVPAFDAPHGQSPSTGLQLPWELLLVRNGADVVADPLHADCLKDQECVHPVRVQAAVDLDQSRLAYPSHACGFVLPAGPDCYPRLAESDCLQQLTADC